VDSSLLRALIQKQILIFPPQLSDYIHRNAAAAMANGNNQVRACRACRTLSWRGAGPHVSAANASAGPGRSGAPARLIRRAPSSSRFAFLKQLDIGQECASLAAIKVMLLMAEDGAGVGAEGLDGLGRSDSNHSGSRGLKRSTSFIRRGSGSNDEWCPPLTSASVRPSRVPGSPGPEPAWRAARLVPPPILTGHASFLPPY